jgi:hypothetical protein
MTLYFRRVSGLNSEIMRQAGSNANVSWSYREIEYKGNGVGYPNADASDATAVKDELERLLGYRPVEIDEPVIDRSADQPQ